ncbi:MAG: formyltetrahydrofolate deformylase [bacterium]|nr:formyltetrahydrofolate deformylase [bacterium]
MDATARLLITCADRPGIVAAVSNFLYSHGANITQLDQHSTDPEGGEFFMRLEFQTPNLDVSKPALENAFQDVVAERFAMKWRISYAARLKRVAILVSKVDHCLAELLWHWKQGRIQCEISQVISNHEDLRHQVEFFGLPYHYVPVSADKKEDSEQTILSLMEGKTDLVVLARYMQILTGAFIDAYPFQIINIHHSFLPAFVGANPYKQAYERGVKLIGATAHYATEQLDAGPIIEQDVARVSHRHSVAELRELGRNLERSCLARAVRWHVEDRILVHGNKTIVFN